MCKNLRYVYCQAATPPVIQSKGTSSSNGVYESAPSFSFQDIEQSVIYVPRTSIEVYKSADGWKDYAKIIKPYDFE